VSLLDVAPDLVKCIGYDDHECDTLLTLASDRKRCRYCEKTLSLDIEVIQSHIVEPQVVYCQCGGVADHAEHGLSLLHIQWVRQGGS
jgi:hypothetical protein